MFKLVWKYFKGYVIIEICGFAVERFLNLCLNKNIDVSDLEESKNGVICKINIGDFKALKGIAKKTGCKYKIKTKYGLPFFIFLHRKRYMLVFSIGLFVFLLYFFSSFIWIINITGAEHTDSNKILAFCEEQGFHIGSFKNNLDPKKLQTDIKNNFDNISWVSVQIKGTTANIKISENILQKNTIDYLEPCDIISTEDGIISSIATREGTPLVKENDIIKKGDILVSGEVIIKESEEIKGTYLTHSDADIRAKIQKSFDITVPFEYYIKEFTGDEKTDYIFTFFNKEIDLTKPSVDYEYSDKNTNINQLKLSDEHPLPFLMKKHTYKEYDKVKKTYSIEEAKTYANKLINEKIISEIDFSSDIINKNVEYLEYEDRIEAKVTLDIIQNIGEKIPVKINYPEGSINTDGTSENTSTE